jgi:hypothetical protein
VGAAAADEMVIPMMNWIVGFIGGIATTGSIIALAVLWRESQGRRPRDVSRIFTLVAQRQGRCDICGAHTERHRKERCKGICEKV